MSADVPDVWTNFSEEKYFTQAFSEPPGYAWTTGFYFYAFVLTGEAATTANYPEISAGDTMTVWVWADVG